MKYLLDIASLCGLIIFCYGLWMIYNPLAPVAFGLAVMLFCYKAASVRLNGKKQ